jgi:hypothetical protein
VEDAILNDIEEHTDEGTAAMHQLLALLGAEHAGLLAELLETIMYGSGYGAVEIVVSEKRIQTLKLTQSFKPIIKPTGGS